MNDITVNVSSKGQITLPKAARQRLGVRPGGQVRLKLGAQPKVVLEKQPGVKDYQGKFTGFWGDRDPAEELRERRDSDRL
jgi:AbrB family looped-hinge helix DNA binding protein